MKFAYDPAIIRKGCDLAMDIISLGKVRGRGVPTVRTRFDDEWADQLGMERPSTIRADELHTLVSNNGSWAGDFVHGEDWSIFEEYCQANNLSL